MIEVYSWATPNGHKVHVMLEECGLDYRAIPVNIGAGEQFKPEFLAISPNNRIPAIVDHAPSDGGAPISVFESGAILLYLADKAGSLIPRDVRGRTHVCSLDPAPLMSADQWLGIYRRFWTDRIDILENILRAQDATPPPPPPKKPLPGKEGE
jgi:hypothetical protein